MVKICIVEACKAEYYPDCGLSYHRFPKNDIMLEKWLSIIPRGDRKVTPNSTICSKHFKPDDYVPNLTRPVLKENALPSLFLLPTSKKVEVISNIQLLPGCSKSEDEPVLTEPPKKKSRNEDIKDVSVQTHKYVRDEELQRKVKLLTQKLRRRDDKIQDTKTLLSIIQKKCKNFDEVQTMIKTNFIDIHNYLNKDKSSRGVRYSDEIKKFALSLYYFSARAYCHLRTHIVLPHPATLEEEYIRILDRIFDLMNCKNPFGTGFKSPLRNENKEVWMNILKETKEYLSSLNINGKNILLHRRKTPILGFIVNILSFEGLALDLLQSEDFKYFLTYKCSQDHLEMLFSCVRARGGSNDNPNALQFRFTLRKLLYKNSVQPSINANCTSNDYEMTPVLEFRHKKKAILDVPDNDDDQTVKLIDLIEKSNVSDFKMNIIYYIAGCITNKMVSKISCSDCLSVLLTNKNTDHEYCTDISKFSAFTTFIDRGGLKYASRFVFETVKYCEKIFTTISRDSLQNLNKNKMILYVLQQFHNKLFKYLEVPHPLQYIQSEEPHEIQLVKSISDSYFNLRSYHATKLKSTRISKASIGLRQKLHKTILFSNL